MKKLRVSPPIRVNKCKRNSRRKLIVGFAKLNKQDALITCKLLKHTHAIWKFLTPHVHSTGVTVQNTAVFLRLLPMVRVLSWARCSVLRRICKVQVRIKTAFFRISQFQLITLDMHRNWHKKTKTQSEEKLCLFARIAIYQNEKWILDWKRNFGHILKMKNSTPRGTRTHNLWIRSPTR